MKKLMIAAAAVAMIGAAQAGDTPRLYKATFQLKTLGAYTINCSTNEGCETCGWSGEFNTNYLTKTSLTLKALLVNCDVCSNTFDTANNGAKVAMVLWDDTHKISLGAGVPRVGGALVKTAAGLLDNGWALADQGANFTTLVFGKSQGRAVVRFNFADATGFQNSLFGHKGWYLNAVGFGAISSWEGQDFSSVCGNVTGTVPVIKDIVNDDGEIVGGAFVSGLIYKPATVCSIVKYCDTNEAGEKLTNAAVTDTVPAYGRFRIVKASDEAARTLSAAYPWWF